MSFAWRPGRRQNLVGGEFTSIGGQPRANIARLDPRLAWPIRSTRIRTRSVSEIQWRLQADGKILVGGVSRAWWGKRAIHRPSRCHDRAGRFVRPDTNGSVLSIVVQADGKILVGGNFFGMNSIGGQRRNHIARLDPTTACPIRSTQREPVGSVYTSRCSQTARY